MVSHKHIGTEDWTNVYFFSADNLTNAAVTGVAIVDAESAVTKNTVTFGYFLVSEREQPYRNYKRIYIDSPGDVAPTVSMHPLPLWNTVRCEFQPSNSGKPDVKQLRLPIYSDEVLDISHITTTFKDFVAAEYIAALLAVGTLEDNAGNPWVSGIVRPEIFDRQLTKRRKKKVVTP